MPKKQGTVQTAIQLHGSENRDQTASHGSLLPFESKPKKNKTKQNKKEHRKQALNSASFRVNHAAPLRVLTRLQPLLKAEASTTVRCYQT